MYAYYNKEKIVLDQYTNVVDCCILAITTGDMILKALFITFLIFGIHFVSNNVYELTLDRVELLNSSYAEGYCNVSIFTIFKYA